MDGRVHGANSKRMLGYNVGWGGGAYGTGAKNLVAQPHGPDFYKPSHPIPYR